MSSPSTKEGDETDDGIEEDEKTAEGGGGSSMTSEEPIISNQMALAEQDGRGFGRGGRRKNSAAVGGGEGLGRRPSPTPDGSVRCRVQG